VLVQEWSIPSTLVCSCFDFTRRRFCFSFGRAVSFARLMVTAVLISSLGFGASQGWIKDLDSPFLSLFPVAGVRSCPLRFADSDSPFLSSFPVAGVRNCPLRPADSSVLQISIPVLKLPPCVLLFGLGQGEFFFL
jgi:hypothetical protein